MNIQSFLLMRNELALIVVALIVLVAELIYSDKNKHKVIGLSLFLFALVIILGFYPMGSGTIFGGMYRTNELIVLMKNILNIGVFIIFLQSVRYLKHEENQVKISEYFILLISTLIGMNFMISSGDFLMFYLGLELATIPIAALAAYDRYKHVSAEAGIKLILSSAFSSGLLLFGISMMYGTTGSVYFRDISQAYGPVISNLNMLSLIFFFTGMSFKVSLVPFHLWTADVYEGAPINITSYLSVISKGAAVFIFTIVLFSVFGSISHFWSPIVYTIAVLTMTIGNLFAIRQQNIKRFLAFSSIAQAGFILLGIIAGTLKGDSGVVGMTSVVYFVLVYIFSNLAAFGVVSAISNYTGKENIDDYNGLYKTNPKLSLIMMIALFSLAGIPPVAGFFGKFFLFTSAAYAGFYWLVLIAVLNATISLYYYLLVVKAMFINKSDNPIGPFKSDWYTRIALIICVAGIFILGFASQVYDHIYTVTKHLLY